MIVFLIDADNLNSPAWIEEAFQKMEKTGDVIVVRRAYGSAENLKGIESVLRARGIRSFVNLALSKNTTDVSLAVDAMELSWQMPRPTTVVVGSGDSDFVPLVVRLRERGIRMVCVSGPGKMSPEAVPWYDEVISVGQEQGVHAASTNRPRRAGSGSSLPAPSAKKAVAKPAPAKKAAAKKVPARKASGKVAVKAPDPAPGADLQIEVQHILDAVPMLGSGQAQTLNDVVKLLHDAKLLGKNATSTKLFKKFPDHFELTPLKQPNKVQYIVPPR